MNIQVQPGLSCSVYSIGAYGPLMSRRKLRQFFASYEKGGDGAYDWQRVIYLTQMGQVLHYEVKGFGRILARFGLEFSEDKGGPYITILYFHGDWIKEYIHQVIWMIFELAGRIAPAGCEPRCKVAGRRGWRRYLRMRGLGVNQHGFVHGWQEYFYHG
jgi:hypothetical protein